MLLVGLPDYFPARGYNITSHLDIYGIKESISSLGETFHPATSCKLLLCFLFDLLTILKECHDKLSVILFLGRALIRFLYHNTIEDEPCERTSRLLRSMFLITMREKIYDSLECAFISRTESKKLRVKLRLRN